jgi:Na+/melibiose symporter-like transporter
LGPFKASGVILAGRVFDAFSDPLIGFLIMKTKLSWGVLRPWMIFAIIPVGIR